MENGKKIALGVTLVGILAIGIRVGLIYQANHEEAPPPKSQDVYKLSDDDTTTINLKKLRPDSLKDARELIGKTIWVSAGGQLDYYKDTGKHVDYAHRVGTLKGAEPLVIKDVFEQVPPKSVPRATMRIPGGQRHVLLAFTMPKSGDEKTLYATPVGDFEDGVYQFQNDNIFFYDDPHEIYKYWGPEVWSHIDKHEAVKGMSERAAMMSLGEVIRPSSDTLGDRSVSYENDGHPMKIVFEHDKAVSVAPEDSF